MKLKLHLIGVILAITCGAQCGLVRATESTIKFKPDWTEIQDLKPDALSSNKPIRQKWLVVVGASKFKEKRLDNSIGMDKAAEDFYQYALDPNAGRFDKDHVRLLVNAQATRQGIMASFGKQWLGSLANPDDLVVVFISTLSFPTTDGKAYLCAYDCALDNVYSTCISIQDFMETLKKEVPAQRIVVILQACYSGAAELTNGSKSLFASRFNFDLNEISLGKGFIILSSSAPDQITWSNSFSENLIKALRENNGMIPLENAFAKARADTESDTNKGSNGLRCQMPVMKSDWKGKPLVLGVPPLTNVSPLPSTVGTFLAAESYYLKANEAVVAGNLDQAIIQYKQALSVDPGYADALSDYAGALALQGKWQEAAELYQKVVDARPSDSLFHLNYACTLAKLGKQDQSVSELEKSLRLDPKNRIALVALANVAIQTGDFGKAAQYLQQAIALYPSSASLHDRLAYVLGRDGAAEPAIKESRLAVTLDPNSLSARLNLAANLLLAGDTAAATKAYRDAIAVSPDNPDAHYCLSQILTKSGDPTAATKELERFQQLSRAINSKSQQSP